MSDLGQHTRVLRFGLFEVDLRAGELYQEGRKVRIQEKPFQVLTMLLERQGQVVTRQELEEHLWPSDTFVDFDHNLNVAIKKVRDALGDSADSPHFIQTVARRGYRFIVPVEDLGGPGPTLRIHPRGHRPWKALLLATTSCLAAAYLAWDHFRPPVQPEPGRIMLAVLPFENLTADREQEYFSDGLTEEMITELGRFNPERLGVIARTTSMHYKNTEKRMDEIGRELGVDYILEGSVRHDSERVRISAQLIQVSDQTHLWARSYERHRGEIFALQREVARAIAEEIELKLTPEQELRLAGGRTMDPEAHENYLKGRYFWNKWTQDDVRKSVEHFRQALAQDSSYALAHAGLASAYAYMGYVNMLPLHEAYQKAKLAALEAMELDETAVDAHTSMGFIALFYEHDWARAEREFQRAIELNPSDPVPHKGHAYYCVVQGRFDQALVEVERARGLDPLSVGTNTDVGFVLYAAREYDRAIEQLQETLQWDSNLSLTHWYLAQVYTAKGMYREALTEWLAGWRLTNGAKTDLDEAMQKAYKETGWRGAWQKRLEYALEAKSKGEFIPAAEMVDIYTRLDDTENALVWLEQAVQEGHYRMAYLGVDPRFDPLRSDPRFQAILRRMNLPRL